ncbi:LysR family transcriptional regulator [Dongia soli]|uniref:LysR family transcriptional regulator n=2 Tax=Dongia soli TaxID=600628 RepID=A0ABU5EI10_9PROT|nr:LysR family transcriptional regulator [Dongia soli]
MNDLELLRVFCAAAEAVSFREAAARLGISPQVVTRSVRELEERLDEALFHRSTRQVRITAYGEQLARQGREMVDSMESMLRPKSARREAQVSGMVRLTAPEALGRGLVMQALAPVLVQHPALTLDLRLSEAFTNAVDQRIDVGVRIGTLRDSRFIARSVAKVAFHVVASPVLIKRAVIPATPADLQALPIIAIIDRNSGRPWPWQFRDAKPFMPKPAFVTDDIEAGREAALLGLGYAQLPNYLARRHLASGQLIEVLAPHAPTPWPVSVYRVSHSPVPARIKLVFDRLVQALAAEKSLR